MEQRIVQLEQALADRDAQLLQVANMAAEAAAQAAIGANQNGNNAAERRDMTLRVRR